LLFVDTRNQLVQWDMLGDRSVEVVGEPGDLRGANLSVSPNGHWVAVDAEPLRVSVWDIATKKQAFVFRDERSAVSATAWSQTGNRLAFGTQDGQVALWDLSVIRQQLAGIHLDWPDEAFEQAKALGNASPLEALTEALQREPKNSMLLLRRASLHLEAGAADKALADLSQGLQADEKNEPALVARSNLYAQLGKWSEAAADAGKAVELNPDAIRNWMVAAILLARAGDGAGYRALCEKMVERFTATGDPQVAQRVILAALLWPEAVDVKRLPRVSVENAVAGFAPSPLSRAEAYTTLALLEVRSGKAESALSLLRRAQEDPTYSKTPSVQSLSFLVQAVAEHAVGKPAIARDSLQASQAFARGISAAAPGGDYVIANQPRLILDILRPEAERLVK
jgi:tetratricopeptide (TPR) repeat protein